MCFAQSVRREAVQVRLQGEEAHVVILLEHGRLPVEVLVNAVNYRVIVGDARGQDDVQVVHGSHHAVLEEIRHVRDLLDIRHLVHCRREERRRGDSVDVKHSLVGGQD